MKLVIFGLSVSSSWGNGHATLWRGLIHALARLGHSVTFFEWETPYYAAHRDCFGLPRGELVLYADWHKIRPHAAEALRNADVGMVTSYCPHGVEATELVLGSSVPVKVFYDLDTPVTLDRLARGEHVPYLGPQGLGGFDLVLSYTGGKALQALQSVLGAKKVAPLYGSVDPGLHTPTARLPRYMADLSYLGTYATDRQQALQTLFLEPAKRLPERCFAIGGSQYPRDFPWLSNVKYFFHVPPYEHSAFYCSARINLNVTRGPMATMGYCPSGRLFEAAACGAAMLTDAWPGLEWFFEPGREILVADSTDDVIEALDRDDQELARIGWSARMRVLAQHTVDHRAAELILALEDGAVRRTDSGSTWATNEMEV